jgi:hypothetical protein
MTKTWVVRSMTDPPMAEKICCESILDAARAWAERMFNQGLLVRTGTSVLVHCVDDPILRRTQGRGDPWKQADGERPTTYQVKISVANMPAFRARLEAVTHERVNDVPRDKEGRRG